MSAICITPGCGGELHARGLCKRCYTIAHNRVRYQKTSWESLEDAGGCLPESHFISDELRQTIVDLLAEGVAWVIIADLAEVGERTVARIAAEQPGRRRKGEKNEEYQVCPTCGYRVRMPCVGCQAKGVGNVGFEQKEE